MKALPRFGAHIATIGALTLALSAPALGQVTTGTLYGRVVDPTGGVVPEAAVIATNTLTATTKVTVTDGRGRSEPPPSQGGGRGRVGGTDVRKVSVCGDTRRAERARRVDRDHSR